MKPKFPLIEHSEGEGKDLAKNPQDGGRIKKTMRQSKGSHRQTSS